MKIQYVIARNDTEFPQGATIAQAVHAVTLCHHEHFDAEYLNYHKEGFSMRTAVLQSSKEQMDELIKELKNREIKHSVWIEQPENIMTAVAIYPYEKDLLKGIPELRKLKLY
ncbi:hypothetical protein NEPAR06_1272 [Nematocida parisii]|uniref:peptidyl-tRNA hydrolase n=1 Tax=Nematocida parisii (strain ERTm3) TaxID=935791 RepID=I3EHP0_NEMP3|nr:hypothetical protein NEQG_01427 [Nematocida parisii ERTm3]KAI5144961.1 hypothetical protein NEPAR07_1372 [Nematocida parisii]KAI5154641.1 hypothetical protein NEPAR06_1272 [Nematocida parisii]KAI5158582.1 hypothetical protein NEPAR05_2115 [Nematocida parisii]